MFSQCRGQGTPTQHNQPFEVRMTNTSANVSVNGGSHSHSSFINSVPPSGSGNFLSACLQSVYCLDPVNSGGIRRVSTLGDDTSSITLNTQQNSALEDGCRIKLGRITKQENGRQLLYIQAKVTLFDDEVDLAHDMLYIVRVPENNSAATTVYSSPDHLLQRRITVDSARLAKGISRAPQPVAPLSMLTKAEVQLNQHEPQAVTSQVQQPVFQSLLSRGAGTRNLAQAAAKQTEFVNQNSGSFTLNPLQAGSYHEHDHKKSLASCTNNSSQPVLGGPREEYQAQASEPRCDTETARQRDDTESLALAESSRAARQNPGVHQVVLQNESSTMHFGQNASYCSLSQSQSSLVNGMQSSHLPESQQRAMAAASGKRLVPRLPRTYQDIQKRYLVELERDPKRSSPNAAMGLFPLNQVPEGTYRIYYFRPKDRNRMIGKASSSAMDKIQRVGRGKDFIIFDRNSSQSPSKHSQSMVESQNPSLDQSAYVHKPAESFRKKTPLKPDQKENQTQPCNALYFKEGKATQPLPKDLDNLQKAYSFQGSSQHRQPCNKSGLEKQRMRTQSNDLSPDEVDALVCMPDSQETDQMSKEQSFNTEKIRLDNLAQPNDFEAQHHHLAHLGAHEVSTMSFGLANLGYGQSTQEALTGLQQIYSVHQMQLKASAPQPATLKSAAQGGGNQSQDTPNLYHTMSQQSLQSNSQDLRSVGETHLASVNFVDPISLEKQAIFDQKESDIAPGAQSKFALRLTATVEDQSPPKKLVNNYLNLVDEQAHCSEQVAGGFVSMQPSNAAIRVEKQTSYSRSDQHSNSSNSAAERLSIRQSKAEAPGLDRIEVVGVTSAFAAAESKVRNSHRQLAKNHQPQGADSFQTDPEMESIDVSVPIMPQADLISRQKTCQITNAIRQVQGPPVLLPGDEISSHSLSELLLNQMPIFSNPCSSQDYKSSISLRADQIESDQFSYLQKLIDTQGPSHTSPLEVDYTQPRNCLQPVIQQIAAAQMLQSQQTSQKHSRAIAGQNSAESQAPAQMVHTTSSQELLEMASESFQSPDKATYREMIQQSNSQNNQQDYDKLTRNSGASSQKQLHAYNGTVQLAYSERKQLSTVEEENASQCSDLTSLHHAQSRFMHTQQSSRSRKSLRNSLQPTHAGHPMSTFGSGGPNERSSHKQRLTEDSGLSCQQESEEQIKPGTGLGLEFKVPPNFKLDGLTGEPRDSAAYRVQAFAIEENERDDDEEEEDDCADTDEKVPVQVSNASADSTQPCSKQLSGVAGGVSHLACTSLQARASGQVVAPRKIEKRNKDYYYMKTGSPENGLYDESSSSLLDLDNTDFNLTSYIAANPGQAQANASKLDPLNLNSHFQSSPYRTYSAGQGPQQQVTNQEGQVANYGLYLEGRNQTFLSQEEAKSSQMLDSVSLTCSEQLNETGGEQSKLGDSARLIHLIDQIPPSDRGVHPSKQSAKTSDKGGVLAFELSQGVSSTKPSSKKTSEKPVVTRKRTQGLTKGTKAAALKQAQVHDFNIKEVQVLSPTLPSDRLSKGAKSQKHSTPLLSKSNKTIPAFAGLSLAEKNMFSPQIGSLSQVKQTLPSSGVLLSQHSRKYQAHAQANPLKGSPPQPLLKNRDVFGKTVALSSTAQSNVTRSSLNSQKSSKAQTGPNSAAAPAAIKRSHKTAQTYSTSSQNGSGASAQSSLNRLLLHNIRPS